MRRVSSQSGHVAITVSLVVLFSDAKKRTRSKDTKIFWENGKIKNMSTSCSYTLFLGREAENTQRHNLGSTLCLSVLDRIPSGVVKVEMATDLPPRDRPLWLKGTPTLFRVETQEQFTGFQAFHRLMDVAFEMLAQKPSSVASAKKAMAAATSPQSPSLPSSAPPVEDSGGGLDDMWTSNESEFDSATEDLGSKKMSQDDFTRAMQSMSRTSVPPQKPSGGSATPLLEPLKD